MKQNQLCGVAAEVLGLCGLLCFLIFKILALFWRLPLLFLAPLLLLLGLALFPSFALCFLL